MNYYLYRITNKINGKIYIGIHQTKDLNDGYFGSGKLLNYAINKHGKENFQLDILEVFASREEMVAMESKVVNEQFINDTQTYNIMLGGDGGPTNMKATDYYKSGLQSENCKHAALMSVNSRRTAKMKRVDEYNKDPIACKLCGTAIDYEKRINTFCSKSCSATYNNTGRVASDIQKQRVSLSIRSLHNKKL